MRGRTVFVIVFCLLLLVAAVEVWNANRALLTEQKISLFGNPVPLGWLLGGMLAGSLLLVFAVLLLNSASNYLRDLGAAHEHRFRESLESRYLRGLEAHLAGRHAEALRLFGELLDLEPGHAGALLRAGESCRQLGRAEEAIAHHRRLVEHQPQDGAAALALTGDYLAAGRRTEARGVLAQYLQRRGGDPTALRKLRAIYVSEENWTAALGVEERLQALKTPPQGDDEALALAIPYELASTSRQAGRGKDAAARLEKLLKAEPTFVPGRVLLGEIAAAADSDPHAAVQVWREGFAATRQPVFLQKIEDLLIAGGDPEAALEVFRAAAAEFPDQLLVRFFLAKLLFRLELRSEAEREFKHLAQLHPDSPTLSYYLGRLAERRGDTREAAEEYRRVIRGARALDIHYRCAHCHEKQDDWADRCSRCNSWNALAVEWRDPSVEKTLPVERPRYLAAGQ